MIIGKKKIKVTLVHNFRNIFVVVVVVVATVAIC